MSRQPMTPLPEPVTLLVDAPQWRYDSSCGAGFGVAHLQIWEAHLYWDRINRSGRETVGLAIVTETGVGASVTNSAEHIRTAISASLTHAMLAPHDPPYALLEWWPESPENPRAHLDQVSAGGDLWWRRIWPSSPKSASHSAFMTWMERYASRLLPDCPYPAPVVGCLTPPAELADRLDAVLSRGVRWSDARELLAPEIGSSSVVDAVWPEVRRLWDEAHPEFCVDDREAEPDHS